MYWITEIVNSNPMQFRNTLFFKRVVTWFSRCTCLSKFQLNYRKMRLLCEKNAVFTPCVIIFIAIATTAAVCTRIRHPAYALVGVRRGGSSPLCHLYYVRWYPPVTRVTHIQKRRIIAFILDKLVAMCRHVQKTSQLWSISQACSYVMDMTRSPSHDVCSFLQLHSHWPGS